MLRQLVIVATAAALGAAPLLVHAQPSPSRPAAGQRVRVNLAGDSGSVVGRVFAWDGDTLMVEGVYLRGRMLHTPMRIPRASIASYQQPVGRDYDRGFSRGVKTGAIVGGTVGLALVVTGIVMDKSREPCDDFCIPATAVGAVLGVGATLGGVLLGATLGTIAAPERWGDPRQVAAAGGARSRRGRLAVTFSLAR